MGETIFIHQYKSSFFVVRPPARVQQILKELEDMLSKKELTSVWKKDLMTGKSFKSKELVTLATYMTTTKDKMLQGFLNSELDWVLDRLSRAGFKDVRLVPYKEYEPFRCDFGIKDFTPRDPQIPAIEHICKPSNKDLAVLEAATGFGKTIISIFYTAKVGARTVFSMTPGHLKTWRSSMKSLTNVTDEDIYELSGAESIKTAVKLQKAGMFNYKVILVSSVTLREFIKSYEENPETFEVDETPLTLWRTLQVGLVVRDEVHEHLHALTKQVIYNSAPAQLMLSATLVSDDPFLNVIYNKVFLQNHRWRSPKNKHVTMYALLYGQTKKIPCRNQFGYSHTTYEKNIIRSKSMFSNYMDLVTLTAQLWLKEYREGKNMMIIASTKIMCKLIVEHLTALYPKLNIKTYIHKDPKENLYDSDIVVGTPGSCGTGIDKPNMSMIVLTTALGSTQLSLQIAGRPRPMKLYPDEDPRFIYFCNTDITAHNNYDIKRRRYMVGNIKSFGMISTGFRI